MESYLPMGAIGVQRRLSRLYNDTKKSSDFVKEPVVQHSEADPEIKSLHRKLRIQKDRLTSWGLEWSDPNQSAEVLIDSSLSKAGLSELVGSIMSTIKDILAEAEPLWNSSRRLAGERVDPEPTPKRGEKIQLVVWDKNRFEDLVRDLTTSIDTLYDLSRTRSSYAQPSPLALRERLTKTTSSTEDLRPFESSRIQTPQHIDPTTLTNLRTMQAEPMTETTGQDTRREIVFMNKQAYADLMQRSGAGAQKQPYAPLLLEYATFDSIYSLTGISPPMARFEKLSAGLQSEPQRSPGSWTGLPRLLGYFEDMENSRFGLVYRFPRTFNPVSFEHLTQNPLYNLCSLADLLARPDFEPKLEAKFRLAANLANTVFDMHARGITHSNLVSDNVSFCNAVGTDPEVSGVTMGEVDIRRPLISAFDLFWDPQTQDAATPFSLYRHPLDPRNSLQSPLAAKADSKTFDLYSLAMILLSVGLWNKLENIVTNPSQPVISEAVLDQLAIRCGTLYMKAVQTCWNAVDQELAGVHTAERIVSHVHLKASRYLEACCIIDGVSNLEERLGDDLGETRPEAASISSLAGPSGAGKSEKARAATPPAARNESDIPSTTPAPAVQQVEPQVETPVTIPEDAKQRSAKMRLYPQVKLSPDIVDQWNLVVMPQINSALRPFYRKNPESVEISLESIGESAQKTKPTVLVVCTSVGKVRAILKKRLGALFEGATGFGLKVCSGQVLRSRNQQPSRSMAGGESDGDDDTAANPGYQERPGNGASIGAWVNDRHLPPVSLGGIIMVDDKLYGMTVHHMLDDPDQKETTLELTEGATRSMAGMAGVQDLAAWYAQQYQTPESDMDPDSSGTEDFACEFSDSESDAFSESAITSDDSDDESERDDESEIGDIPGIEPGCGEGYVITQPALDDVPEEFYPSPETQDEDHLDSYSLGEMYASSGIRRRNEYGLVHEIDWALFEFRDDRQPCENLIPRAQTQPDQSASGSGAGATVIHPASVAPWKTLPGLEVQCMARTSGLQTGLILPALNSVKLYGRVSPSHTYQVTGAPAASSGVNADGSRGRRLPMGVPGDSGAWIVDRDHGQVCGHVLAWSARKRVAYICPMDVLLIDIAETLEASEIRLPGGEVVVSTLTRTKRASRAIAFGHGGESPILPQVGRRQSRRSQLHGQRDSFLAGSETAVDDDDGDDSYDEAVEVVELARKLKQAEIESKIPVEMDKWVA
ncbi:hypothetical protein QBC37DRAFT_157454 [Rhypophila decipiens]|uniref:Protein kinase domain-containing protein n=1 Tax=Rhypophila decipiens TaxID=261697 RepID=A0AAN7B685_9PEZI|nr:hypothetical protein QBC37DRAFT_157454 [Rhypophila decipiens]